MFFKEILEKTLPVVQRHDFLKKIYLINIIEDVITYETDLKEKDFFNPEKVYDKLYSEFKDLNSLPDSLKFLKIFYFASKNTPLKKCVEELKDEIDPLNGYFKENLITDIKAARKRIDIATFVLMNYEIKKIKELVEKNEFFEFLNDEILKINIDNSFKKVKEWIDRYTNTMGIDEYNELIDALEVFFGHYDVKELFKDKKEDKDKEENKNRKGKPIIDIDEDMPF